MSRITESMDTLSEMQSALAKGANGKVHDESRVALKKFSGAFQRLMKSREASYVILECADELGLYGDKASRLHAICGGNTEAAAMVIFGVRFGLVTKDNLHAALRIGHANELDIGRVVLETKARHEQSPVPFPQRPARRSRRANPGGSDHG
jgi:hypothetical protein